MIIYQNIIVKKNIYGNLFIYKFYKDDYKPLEYAINNDNGLYLLTNLYDKGIYEINTVKDCFNSDIPNLYNIRKIGFIMEDKNLN